MDISFVAESVSIATNLRLGFAKTILLPSHDSTSNSSLIFISDSASDQYSSSSSAIALQISGAIFIVDALAPPRAKSNTNRTARRTLLKKKRRTRRSSFNGESEDREDYGLGGDGFDGPFGGGSGGDGRGWNSDRFGWNNWDDSSSPSYGPASNFVYEVIYWIALSNCVHFAFKKVIRIVTDGIGDAEREKAA